MLSKKIQNNKISNTKNTVNSNVSNNKMIITKDLTFSVIDFYKLMLEYINVETE